MTAEGRAESPDELREQDERQPIAAAAPTEISLSRLRGYARTAEQLNSRHEVGS